MTKKRTHKLTAHLICKTISEGFTYGASIAEELGVARTTIHKWIHDKLLPKGLIEIDFIEGNGKVCICYRLAPLGIRLVNYHSRSVSRPENKEFFLYNVDNFVAVFRIIKGDEIVLEGKTWFPNGWVGSSEYVQTVLGDVKAVKYPGKIEIFVNAESYEKAVAKAVGARTELCKKYSQLDLETLPSLERMPEMGKICTPCIEEIAEKTIVRNDIFNIDSSPFCPNCGKSLEIKEVCSECQERAVKGAGHLEWKLNKENPQESVRKIDRSIRLLMDDKVADALEHLPKTIENLNSLQVVKRDVKIQATEYLVSADVEQNLSSRIEKLENEINELKER